ncbi:hypothetical protein FA15DRAFT_671899 [Coprinopsis marcescibilis]|uniref:Rhodopsin domain-containing protein n=1 Tax=Coprinopsis marcescibilis TaxID=230819 RepID=A0A5C3KPM2_COPMA|nr:hypothetical protein FA15DRAFT_671899 [Coprinopsis marcescibilis]
MPSLEDINRTFTAVVSLHFLSIIVTCVRLCHRFKRRQLWWDDFWALVSALFAAFIAAYYISHILRSRDTYSEVVQNFLSWIPFFITPLAMWTARFSILITTIRIIPPGVNKTISQGSFCVFVLMLVAVLLSAVFLCGIPLPARPSEACGYTTRTAIVQLTLGISATVWLAAWPSYILSRMKLPRADRNVVIACFAFGTSLVAVEAIHAANIVRLINFPREMMQTFDPIPITFSGNFQVILPLLTCNSLVLVTYLYRVWRNRKRHNGNDNSTSDESDDDTSGTTSTSQGRGTGRSGVTTTGITSSLQLTTVLSDPSQSPSDNSNQLSGDSRKPPVRVLIAGSADSTSRHADSGV